MKSSYIISLVFFSALLILSGMMDGLTETLQHHYTAFSARFPGADPYWWNPALSWENKGAGFLNRTILVIFSDAYHLLRFLSRVLLASALFGFGYRSPKFLGSCFLQFYVPLLLIQSLFWFLAFQFTYSILF